MIFLSKGSPLVDNDGYIIGIATWNTVWKINSSQKPRRFFILLIIIILFFIRQCGQGIFFSSKFNIDIKKRNDR